MNKYAHLANKPAKEVLKNRLNGRYKCATKIAYDEESAKVVAEDYSKASGDHYRAYYCRVCHRWHLSNKSKQKRHKDETRK